WELHEQPFDFYRYTPSGLEHLLRKAGFAGIKVRPRNDCFSTLAQLLRNAGAVMGRRPDGLDPKREAAAAELARLADVVAAYAPLDAEWIFPLGHSVTAVRPASRVPARSRCSRSSGSWQRLGSSSRPRRESSAPRTTPRSSSTRPTSN